ncbi:mitochondrial import receptor subunit tom22 [Echinococcus multilocularis]|uniref:Mitochondrial import receptor subunit TOM22 homolog n=1 Tax=Echinococcus multilocularis TaxID=6211 RepID=A0A087VZJ3_ECHMU|nr:mitochondrial import receptor subunit tom22 [Echinococcus multilocularis]
MCAERNGEDFIQVDVSTDEDASASASAPAPEPAPPPPLLLPQLGPQQMLSEETSPEIEVIPPVLASSSPPLVAPPAIQTLIIDEVTQGDTDDDDDSDFEDETLAERLLGLTEMFPEWLRSAAASALDGTVVMVRGAYSLSRSSAWFAASVMTVCMLPLMLELERNQMEEQEASEHRSMMLGPGGAGTQGLAGFQVNMPLLSPAIAK